VSLRFQVAGGKGSASEFVGVSLHQAFAEYVVSCIILFISVLNFIG